jgi:hypothetical protein
MDIPAVDSLWIDNDPRSARVRYVLVTSTPDDRDKVQCLSWYDVAGGTHEARPSKSSIQRFQPLSNGHWSRTGFRPAEAGPVLGYPYGYGPNAEQFTGSGS